MTIAPKIILAFFIYKDLLFKADFDKSIEKLRKTNGIGATKMLFNLCSIAIFLSYSCGFENLHIHRNKKLRNRGVFLVGPPAPIAIGRTRHLL
jgi:hypothetical protein